MGRVERVAGGVKRTDDSPPCKGGVRGWVRARPCELRTLRKRLGFAIATHPQPLPEREGSFQALPYPFNPSATSTARFTAGRSPIRRVQSASLGQSPSTALSAASAHFQLIMSAIE